jgi:hypothetical protein
MTRRNAEAAPLFNTNDEKIERYQAYANIAGLTPRLGPPVSACPDPRARLNW